MEQSQQNQCYESYDLRPPKVTSLFLRMCFPFSRPTHTVDAEVLLHNLGATSISRSMHFFYIQVA